MSEIWESLIGFLLVAVFMGVWGFVTVGIVCFLFGKGITLEDLEEDEDGNEIQ